MTFRRWMPALVVFLALAACADAPPSTGSGSGIQHATAPDALLLRVGFEGGFVPAEWLATSIPTFSLYGDGTLVVPGAQIEIYPSPALPAISFRHVDESGIQALLAAALDATDDLPADLGDMGTIGIADAPTTVITVRAGDVDRTAKAYALAELPDRPQGMSEDVFRARQRLGAFVTELGTLDRWLPQGSLGPEEAYEGSSARLFVTDYRPAEDLPQDAIAWPLGSNLSSFGEPIDVPQGRCGTVGGADWDSLRAAAERANELTPWTDAGRRFGILFRPLLPDETGCAPILPSS
jgi:hypothetical protein